MDAQLFEKIYAVIVAKETTYDGIYYTGVKTTKIVCRPSCRAKTPKRENITFYTNVEAAIKDGFRPCKRCSPEALTVHGPDALIVEQTKAFIEEKFADQLTLQQIASHLRISPFHLQRVFKRVTGITPAVYMDTIRLTYAKQLLQQNQLSIKQIADAVGFRSQAYFSSWFRAKTGSTPFLYKNQWQ